MTRIRTALRRMSRDERGFVTNFFVRTVNTHFIRYQTDTEEGASGSPVCNDHWEVVALHHAHGPTLAEQVPQEVIAGNPELEFSSEVKKLGKQKPCRQRILPSDPLDEFLVEPLALSDFNRCH